VSEKNKKIKTIKKATKIVKKIDDYDEARVIVNIIMASFDITTKCLGR